MDLNKKKAKQTFNQPKKEVLTLEARHSISIEAANKIRSKLSPRLFMPKVPVYIYTTKFSHCSPELRPTVLKTNNLRNQEFNSKYQTEIVHDLGKRLKFIKQSHCDKSNKTMEHDIDLFRGNSRKKFRSKNIKRSPKDLKHSLAVAIQNLEKPMDMQSVVSAKETAIRNWGNFKRPQNENSVNSARYVRADDISMDGPLVLNLPKSLYKDKSASEAKKLKKKFVQTLKKSVINNSPALLNRNNDSSKNLQVTKQQSNKSIRKSIFSAKTPPTKVAKSSKEYTNEEYKESACTKIDFGTRSEVKKRCSNIVRKISTKNTINSIDLPNFTNSLSANENTKRLKCKEKVKEHIGSKTNLQNIAKENLTTFIEKTSTKTPEQEAKISPQTKSEANAKREQTKLKLISKETRKQATATGTSKPNNLSSTEHSKTANPSIKHALYSYIHPTAKAVVDFQNVVRSSVSQICDCSPLDKRINEDLMNLDKSVASFYKYLLQTYNDVEENELKTYNGIEYLRQKEENRRKRVQLSRSQTSSLNQPKIDDPTLRIFIDADRMPTQCITFKMSDMLCPKPIVVSDKSSKNSLNNSIQNLTNLRSKNSYETTYISKQVSTEINEPTTEMQNPMEIQKSNKKFTGLRTKVTPKKVKPLVSPTQNQTSLSVGTYNAYETNFFKSATTNTSAYTNLVYTQAQNYDNSYLAPYPLELHNIGYKSSTSIAKQILTNSPLAVTNCYNYSHATTDLNTSEILLAESRRTNLYSSEQCFDRELSQVPNENPHPNRFEYHSSLRKEPHINNHYIHNANDSNAYCFQSPNNLSTRNLPVFADTQISYS